MLTTIDQHRPGSDYGRVTFTDTKTLEQITVCIYRAGSDNSWVVELDTTFEPNISGLRVWINDSQVTGDRT